MEPKERCLRCMEGVVINGRCVKCGSVVEYAQNRRRDALPSRYILHGRYLIGDVLGNGGFSITYAAWDRISKHRVAIKELFVPAHMQRDPGEYAVKPRPGQDDFANYAKKSFLNEARLLRQLNGEAGVLRVYDHFNDNATAYYVMEYLDGSDLKALLIKNGSLDWDRLAPLIRDTLAALAAIHRRGLIHRDISPDNLFLTRDGKIHLIDFGSVRSYEDGESHTVAIKQGFAPYEQYTRRGRQGPWTDIYALSVTIYYCLSGRLPDSSTNRIYEDKVKPLGELVPQIPAYISQALIKGMAVRPEDRCQSALELYRLLFPGGTPVKAYSQTVRPADNSTAVSQNKTPVPRVKSDGRQLHCLAGEFAGRRWELKLGVYLSMGRGDCLIKYSELASGVSRSQCTLTLDMNGDVLIRDDGSSYGTFLNGRRLKPGLWLGAEIGARLNFGHELLEIR